MQKVVKKSNNEKNKMLKKDYVKNKKVVETIPKEKKISLLPLIILNILTIILIMVSIALSILSYSIVENVGITVMQYSRSLNEAINNFAEMNEDNNKYVRENVSTNSLIVTNVAEKIVHTTNIVESNVNDEFQKNSIEESDNNTENAEDIKAKNEKEKKKRGLSDFTISFTITKEQLEYVSESEIRKMVKLLDTIYDVTTSTQLVDNGDNTYDALLTISGVADNGTKILICDDIKVKVQGIEITVS